MAPMIHPEKTAARDNFGHITVNTIGMTDGLKTTPLQDERVGGLGAETEINALDIK